MCVCVCVCVCGDAGEGWLLVVAVPAGRRGLTCGRVCVRAQELSAMLTGADVAFAMRILDDGIGAVS